MEPTTRAIVLPIFRRYWLWHAWQEAGSAAAGASNAGSKAGAAATSSNMLRSWRDGVNIEEKTQLLGQQATRWVQNKLWAEWRKLEVAPEGSLRNRGYRMAQAVLAREDPRETFLKNIPAKPGPMEVIYPTAFREKLVRRRLRHVAAEGRRRHMTRLMWWALAMVPQLPLMLTPLPNITVYYTGYRLYSHLRALQGAKALEQSLEQLNSKQLQDLRVALLTLKERNPEFVFRPKEWPERLMRKEHRYLDMLERMAYLERLRELRRLKEAGGELPQWQQQAAQRDAAAAAAANPQPLLSFTPSVELNELARPADRLSSPLGDDAAISVGRLLGAEHMIEMVARARRRAVGSMFPSVSSSGGSSMGTRTPG
ncbi:hypothetical protein ABPG77_008973 [Micractinium sp. CCAP 211/92]